MCYFFPKNISDRFKNENRRNVNDRQRNSVSSAATCCLSHINLTKNLRLTRLVQKPSFNARNCKGSDVNYGKHIARCTTVPCTCVSLTTSFYADLIGTCCAYPVQNQKAISTAALRAQQTQRNADDSYAGATRALGSGVTNLPDALLGLNYKRVYAACLPRSLWPTTEHMHKADCN